MFSYNFIYDMTEACFSLANNFNISTFKSIVYLNLFWKLFKTRAVDNLKKCRRNHSHYKHSSKIEIFIRIGRMFIYLKKNKSKICIMRRRLYVLINICNVYLPNLAILLVFGIQEKTMLPWSSKQTKKL